jgi:type I restriction-modification system DNA methylase subunit
MITSDLSPAALESEIAKALRGCLRSKGFRVTHNGSTTTPARGGVPDIDADSPDVHLVVEATKMRLVAQSNAESTSVTAHLDKRAAKSPGKLNIGILISPATATRTREHFRLYNKDHENDGRLFVGMDFDAFNLLTAFLLSNEGQSVAIKDLTDALVECAAVSSDTDVLAILNQRLLKTPKLDIELQRLRKRQLADKYSKLDSIFKKIHDGLRTVVGLGPAEAFHELSKLIFLKMFEEQRVDTEIREGRLTVTAFTTVYIDTQKRRTPPPRLHPIIELFDRVAEDYASDKLFDSGESIDIEREKIDDSYIDVIVGLIQDFQFIDPAIPIDIKGLIYEQFLGLSLRNTDLGQYFTPDPIISFMVKLARLSSVDHVHDPAAGTGRFLVAAMSDMTAKAQSQDEVQRIKGEQLTGVEKSPYVAKIAKMNMFVHGDGRTNIVRGDSLEFDLEGTPYADVILTNPPLGDINFSNIKGRYDSAVAWYEAMAIIPRTTSGQKIKIGRSTLKGGALFLNIFTRLAKDGGRVLTVIDEGILNTDEYSHARDYLREHFEIRAVVSLTDDAFKYASNTATKTSILYLVRKDHTQPQTRPVFFGHAFSVGINTKGKSARNDLDDLSAPNDLLRAYIDFERRVDRAHDRREQFDVDEFPPAKLSGVGFQPYSDFSYFVVPADSLQDRLEYKWYDPTFDAAERQIADMDTVRLGDIVTSQGDYGKTATGLEEGDHMFINIENLQADGSISLEGVRYVLDETVADIDEEGNSRIRPKWQTTLNDILISRARLPGIASVVTEKVAGLIYGSYIIRFRLKADAEFDPLYVALFINSVFGQAQIHRLKSGSNGSNINAPQLSELRILRLTRGEQERVVTTIRRQQDIAGRLGELMRHYQETAEGLLVEACLGEETKTQLTHLDERLLPPLNAAQEVLAGLDRENDSVDSFRRLADHFVIRPTFSGRSPRRGAE